MNRLWPTLAMTGAVLALMLPATSSASCVPFTTKQQEQRADVIFVGVALEGPTQTGSQRFRVVRYLKGTGPKTAAVATGVVARADGSGSTTSVSVNVNAGERWQIYATRRSASGVLETNVCDGSGKLASASKGAGTPTPGSPTATTTGEDRTKAVILATCFAAAVLLAFAVRRRPTRRVSSTG